MTELWAGLARVRITPPIGIRLVGYAVREGVSNGVQKDLHATALVLTDGSTKVAIVGCDLIFLWSPYIDDLRDRIASSIGVGRDHVLINFSHTHSAPMFPGFQHEESPQAEIQARYYDNLKDILLGVVNWADSRLCRARIGFGRGKSYIGINRREIVDGTTVLGEDPGGPMDPDVSVMRVDRLDGQPIAIVYSHGCHTVTMGPKSNVISPDFVGPANCLIEYATGATALFLQGTAGDIDPICGIGAEEDNSENMIRIGNSLGADALKVAMEIRTHNQRGPRWFFGSLAKASTWTYVPVESSGLESLKVRSRTIDLPLMETPPLEEVEAILSQKKENYEKAKAAGARENAIVIAERYYRWARVLHETVSSGIRRPSRPAEVQVVRINDVALVAIPVEALSEIGLEVKRRSPIPNTVLLGYSNGCLSYLPPAHCYPASGWSPRETYAIPDMIFQAYLLPTALDPSCAQRVVDTAVEVLEETVG